MPLLNYCGNDKFESKKLFPNTAILNLYFTPLEYSLQTRIRFFSTKGR
jgi:hypothetical protein